MRYTRIYRDLTEIQWGLLTGHAALLELIYTDQPQSLEELCVVLKRQIEETPNYSYVAARYLTENYTKRVLSACTAAGLIIPHS